jgi:phospholipid/cholesterol/gamma-HCH transport system substrate-binding protein
MIYKLKHTRHIVTLFIIIPAVVLITTVVFIALKQNMLEKRYHYFSSLENAMGISTQTPVLYKGFEIGRVHSFELNEDGTIKLDFYVLKRYKTFIVQASVLYRTTNPITSKTTLEYVRSTENLSTLEEGAHIPSTDFAEGRSLLRLYLPKASDPIAAIIENIELLTRELNMDDNADKGSLMRILVSVADLSQKADGTLDLLNDNLSQMNTLISNLNSDHNPEDGVILRILNNLADLSESVAGQTEDIERLLATANRAADNYAEPESLIIKMLDPQGDQIFAPLGSSLYTLSATLSDLQKIMASLSRSNPELLLMINNLNETLEKASKTLEGLNNNPLLRKGIPESRIKAFAPDGRFHELPDE